MWRFLGLFVEGPVPGRRSPIRAIGREGRKGGGACDGAGPYEAALAGDEGHGRPPRRASRVGTAGHGAASGYQRAFSITITLSLVEIGRDAGSAKAVVADLGYDGTFSSISSSLSSADFDKMYARDTPSPHGRTRMIVFPSRRSVRLKAATASSR